jgi:GNAT superfamily N-acetyltransferase
MVTSEQDSVVPATDEGRAIATITIAFSDDPVVRWAFPAAHDYLALWPGFVLAFAGAAFGRGTADSLDDHGGVAMWLPPDVTSDEDAMGEILSEAMPADQHDELFAFLEQMDDFHPSESHWYLPLIGVDTTAQGRGYGSTLLRHALDRCDRDHLPAYLEATAPRNRALYARHGFEELGVIQAGTSPPMWPMLRHPS